MDRGKRKEEKRKKRFLNEMLERDHKMKRPKESVLKIKKNNNI